MMTSSIYGRLGRDVREIQTKSGKPMAVVGVAVDVGKPDAQETLWLDLVGFGGMAEKLLQHQKSDMVSASGRVSVNKWTDNQGNERETWQLIIDTLVSARTVRPGKRKQSPVMEPSSNEPPPHTEAPHDFNDEIPF